jgi:DNA-binding MarR family transcriptional regulator
MDTDTPTRLRTAIGKLHRRLRPTSAGADAGLTPTRHSLLFTVLRRGPIRLTDLAAAEGINPTMLSRIVSDLSEGGLLARTCDPTDRRAALVEVTDAGRRLADQMRSERTDVLSRALHSLEAGDRETLELALPALERLGEALRERSR